MNLTIACIFVSVVSCSLAEIRTWRTEHERAINPYGMPPNWYCDHELDVKSTSEVLGNDETVSQESRCDNFNSKCVVTHTYSHSSTTTHTVGVDLAGNLAMLNTFLTSITAKYSVAFGTSASISGSMACHTEPGWKSWISFQPKFIRVEGTLTKKCHHRENGWISAKNTESSGHSVSTTPKKKSDGREDGIITCRSSAIADTSGGTIIYNLQKFPNGAEKDVVQKAVEQVINSVMARTSVQKKVCESGVEVWAEGQCFNGIYNSVCKGCLQQLYTTLFKDCRDGRGCRSKVRDCTIRYEFYAFEEASS